MSETVSADEQTIVENSFGTVTSKRVVYFRAKGWFSGGSREDIPLQHVTSVRLDTSRKVVVGVILLLIGFALLGRNEGGVKIAGTAMMIWGGLIIWGSPAVIVNTAGRDLNAAKGFPWKRGEATAFVEALRSELFKAK